MTDDIVKIKDIWTGDFPNEENWIKQNVRPTYIANEEGMTDHLFGIEVSEMLMEDVDIPDYINPFLIIEVGNASYFRFID